LADFQGKVYPHSGHPSSEGRAQDSVSSPAKDRRSANCATQPLVKCHISWTSRVHSAKVKVTTWRVV